MQCCFLSLSLTFIIVVVIKEIQVFVGGKFFLQPKMSPSDSQKPLALDNRRVFVNFSYFLFFHSVVVGLTSCLMRLFYSTIIGVWLVGRIDRPVMPKGYEQCDSGYTVWIGMLFLDHYHTNPILVCFCQILCDKFKQKNLSANSYLSLCKSLDIGKLESQATWPVGMLSNRGRLKENLHFWGRSPEHCRLFHLDGSHN
uniref:Uncharacterized protein n=1 Tax=Laticauda laticaudata TaxID=8630 RepID=A0A8C5WTF5_LATLA